MLVCFGSFGLVFGLLSEGRGEFTGCAAIVEEDLGVCLGLCLVWRDCDCVLVAFAGAGAVEVALAGGLEGHCLAGLMVVSFSREMEIGCTGGFSGDGVPQQ